MDIRAKVEARRAELFQQQQRLEAEARSKKAEQERVAEAAAATRLAKLNTPAADTPAVAEETLPRETESYGCDNASVAFVKAVQELGSKELVLDVRSYKPFGLSSDELIAFERERVRLLANREREGVARLYQTKKANGALSPEKKLAETKTDQLLAARARKMWSPDETRTFWMLVAGAVLPFLLGAWQLGIVFLLITVAQSIMVTGKYKRQLWDELARRESIS